MVKNHFKLKCKYLPYSYYDGCNTCGCAVDGGVSFCTLVACPYFVPICECKSCQDGYELSDDGQSCDPVTTDAPSIDCCDQVPNCAGYVSYILSCNTWHSRHIYIYIYSYYDGCNYCGCSEDGDTSFCTRRFCFDFDPVCECRSCQNGYELSDDGESCDPATTGEPIACTADAFQCPDGSFVGRDPNNNCQFFPCPPDCSAVLCLRPICDEDEELVTPDGECCPICQTSYNQSSLYIYYYKYHTIIVQYIYKL